MKANKISLDPAKPDKLFYVVANIVIYRASDKRCLILKRADTETVHPGKYCAFVRPDETPVVLLKFAGNYKGGDVVLEQASFSDFAWVNAEEVKEYDCIEGIQDEVVKTISLFN